MFTHLHFAIIGTHFILKLLFEKLYFWQNSKINKNIVNLMTAIEYYSGAFDDTLSGWHNMIYNKQSYPLWVWSQKYRKATRHKYFTTDIHSWRFRTHFNLRSENHRKSKCETRFKPYKMWTILRVLHIYYGSVLYYTFISTYHTSMVYIIIPSRWLRLR